MSAAIECLSQRMHDSAHYLLCLLPMVRAGHISEYGSCTQVLTARAVVDDFGDLVLVRGWL